MAGHIFYGSLDLNRQRPVSLRYMFIATMTDGLTKSRYAQ